MGKCIVPMMVSCFAYALRCGWLIAAYIDQDRRDSWAWWISFVWAPTLAVSIVLLYSVRKRDSAVQEFTAVESDSNHNNNNDTNSGSGDNDDSQQPLLLRPQPPEEAFRAFHIFRQGDGDLNDSLSLSSPIPRRTLKDGGEDATAFSAISSAQEIGETV